jgi:hypothetical protein
MLTNTLSPVASNAWAPALFKVAAAVTFSCGVVIHVGRMIVGLEEWVQQVFTPPVDIAFGVLILIATVPGAMSWRRYSGGRAGRIGYGYAMLIVRRNWCGTAPRSSPQSVTTLPHFGATPAADPPNSIGPPVPVADTMRAHRIYFCRPVKNLNTVVVRTVAGGVGRSVRSDRVRLQSMQ